jgi:hypothetical protein
MANSRVIVGARVVAYLNGQIWGRVTAFSFDSVTNRKPIHTIDVQWAQELAATTVETTGSFSLLRLAQDGGAQGAQAVASQANTSMEKYVSILIIDRATDTTLFQTDNAQITHESWSVNSRGRFEGNVAFSSILWSNEAT